MARLTVPPLISIGFALNKRECINGIYMFQVIPEVWWEDYHQLYDNTLWLR